MTSRSWRGMHRDLALEHRLGLARLALGLGLTDAGDDVEARLERSLAPAARTVSSVSPNSWRRSECPTIAPVTPSSSEHRRATPRP